VTYVAKLHPAGTKSPLPAAPGAFATGCSQPHWYKLISPLSTMSQHSKDSLNWYAVYTRSNAERKAQEKVARIGVEAFLPLHSVLRQWSDRKKKMQMPLFPNYLFVKTSREREFDLLHIPELVRFISFGGTPLAIPEKEIESIRYVLVGGAEIHREEFRYRCGEKVIITKGRFAGVEGFVTKSGLKRLVIQIEALQQAISIDIPVDCVSSQ
jgi:transcription antitermination factor NusG